MRKLAIEWYRKQIVPYAVDPSTNTPMTTTTISRALDEKKKLSTQAVEAE